MIRFWWQKIAAEISGSWRGEHICEFFVIVMWFAIVTPFCDQWKGAAVNDTSRFFILTKNGSTISNCTVRFDWLFFIVVWHMKHQSWPWCSFKLMIVLPAKNCKKNPKTDIATVASYGFVLEGHFKTFIRHFSHSQLTGGKWWKRRTSTDPGTSPRSRATWFSSSRCGSATACSCLVDLSYEYLSWMFFHTN